MGSRPTTPPSSGDLPMRKTGRRSARRRTPCGRHKGGAAAAGAPAYSSVSEKLEALKQLIPALNAGERKGDELFQETAEYILLLRTQVSILQKLIDIYASGSNSAVS